MPFMFRYHPSSFLFFFFLVFKINHCSIQVHIMFAITVVWMEKFLAHQNSYVVILTPNVMVLGSMAFGVIKSQDQCPYKKRQVAYSLTLLSQSCEDRKKLPSANCKAGSHLTPDQLEPGFQTTQSPELLQTHFQWLSHSVYGDLLQQTRLETVPCIYL